MTKRTIDRAIRHLGLVIQHARGAGYSYFTDAQGSQVGESVMVCYLDSLTLEGWIAQAERAKIDAEASEAYWRAMREGSQGITARDVAPVAPKPEARK